MKKIFATLAVAVAEGDLVKAAEIAEEAAEWEKSLTDAEKEEIAKALGESLNF